MFLIITAQQILDKEIEVLEKDTESNESDLLQDSKEAACPLQVANKKPEVNTMTDDTKKGVGASSSADTNSSENSSQSDCDCDESRIYSMLKTLREKLSFDL